MFTLENVIGLFVPQTGQNGRLVDNQEYQERIDKISREFSSLFGGYHSFIGGIGGYLLGNGQLCQEPSTLVLSWCTREAYNDHYEHIILLASRLANDWHQETIGVINRKFQLELVDQTEQERTETAVLVPEKL